jgi:hypothetical protein
LKPYDKTKECKGCVCSICKLRSYSEELCEYCSCDDCDQGFAEVHYCCSDLQKILEEVTECKS